MESSKEQEEEEIKRRKTEELRREKRLKQEEENRKLEQLRIELQLKLQIKQDEESMSRNQEEEKLQMKEEEDARRKSKLREEEENCKLDKFLTELRWTNTVRSALSQPMLKYEPGPYCHLFIDRPYDIIPRDTSCQHVEDYFDFSLTKTEAEWKARVVSGGMDPVLDGPHRDGERFHYHPHGRCYVRIKSEPFKLYNFHFGYGSTCAKVENFQTKFQKRETIRETQ